MKVKYAGNDSYSFYCPGCRHTHTIPTTGGKAWEFNGNINSPTFTPSLLNRWGTYADPDWTAGNPELTSKLSGQCHLFITDGKIIFCGDCTHDHTGKTVVMQDIPAEAP